MATRLKLCEMRSFPTSPNSLRHEVVTKTILHSFFETRCISESDIHHRHTQSISSSCTACYRSNNYDPVASKRLRDNVHQNVDNDGDRRQQSIQSSTTHIYASARHQSLGSLYGFLTQCSMKDRAACRNKNKQHFDIRYISSSLVSDMGDARIAHWPKVYATVATNENNLTVTTQSFVQASDTFLCTTKRGLHTR